MLARPTGRCRLSPPERFRFGPVVPRGRASTGTRLRLAVPGVPCSRHGHSAGAVGCALTRCPDAAGLLMAMTWWRRTAAAKSGTVCVLFSMSAVNAAEARPTFAGAPATPVSEGHLCVSGAGTPSKVNGASMFAEPSATAWMPTATYRASSRNCRPWLTFAALDHHHRDRQQIAKLAAGQIAVAAHSPRGHHQLFVVGEHCAGTKRRACRATSLGCAR